MERILMNLSQEETNNFLTSIEMVARLLAKGRQDKDRQKEES